MRVLLSTACAASLSHRVSSLSLSPSLLPAHVHEQQGHVLFFATSRYPNVTPQRKATLLSLRKGYAECGFWG